MTAARHICACCSPLSPRTGRPPPRNRWPGVLRAMAASPTMTAERILDAWQRMRDA